MKIRAFGSKVILEKQEEKVDNNLFIAKTEGVFGKGKIISIGKLVALDLFKTLDIGTDIVYYLDKSSPLGLGFPDKFEVIEAEHIIGVIDDEQK